MNYPKQWVTALREIGLHSRIDDDPRIINTVFPEDVLNALSRVDALKEPPKPREWWVCLRCGRASELRHSGDTHNYSFDDRCSGGKMVRTREVVEKQ